MGHQLAWWKILRISKGNLETQDRRVDRQLEVESYDSEIVHPHNATTLGALGKPRKVDLTGSDTWNYFSFTIVMHSSDHVVEFHSRICLLRNSRR